MKKYLISSVALALMVTTAACSKAEASEVNPYVTAGYMHQWTTGSGQEDAMGIKQRDRGAVHAAVGNEFSNGIRAQVEYSQSKALASQVDASNTVRTKQETVMAVASYPLLKTVTGVNVYALGGAGYTKITAKGKDTSDGLVATAGLGTEWVANPTVTFFGEARGQWVEHGNYWQPQAIAGVRLNTFQVYKNITGQ